MTESNHSGAAHDGARSQEKAPEDPPGGQIRLPFLRAQGARRTEGARHAEGADGAGRVDGFEWVEEVQPAHDAQVTWPGQAEATAAAGPHLRRLEASLRQRGRPGQKPLKTSIRAATPGR